MIKASHLQFILNHLKHLSRNWHEEVRRTVEIYNLFEILNFKIWSTFGNFWHFRSVNDLSRFYY